MALLALEGKVTMKMGSPACVDSPFGPLKQLMAALEGELLPIQEQEKSSFVNPQFLAKQMSPDSTPKKRKLEVKPERNEQKVAADDWDDNFDEGNLDAEPEEDLEVDSEEELADSNFKNEKSGKDSSKRPKNGKRSSSKNVNNKKRSHPHVLGKNKFKDASVQVLLQQRKKGTRALSPKDIWCFIQKYDLIDTKGKTPQSSLCAALSLDVKKGNDSVFVKVGTGMYALREDPNHSNSDLQHYLHAVKSYYRKNRKSESDSEEEDVKRPKSPKINEDKEVEDMSPPVDSHSPQWLGDCLCKTPSRHFYSAVSYNNQQYRVGECAYFAAPDETQQAYLGRITSLYQLCDKGRVCSPEGMIAECIWYFYPEDTHCGRLPTHELHEVFLSSSRDKRCLNTILPTKPQVLSFKEFEERRSAGEPLEDIYFSSLFYDSSESLQFRPLERIENPYQNIVHTLDSSLSSKDVISLLKAQISLLSAELHLSKMDMENATIQLQEYKNQHTAALSEISSGNVTPVTSDTNADSPKQTEIQPLENQVEDIKDLQNDFTLKKRKKEN